MTKKNMMLTLALVALLAIGVPGSMTAQDNSSGLEDPPAEGRWDEKPGWGRGGRGHGRPGMRGRGPVGFLGGPGGAGAHGLRTALRSLDLSESQHEEIRTIFEGERDQARANHERMRTLGEDLRDQIENDPYNEEAVRARAAAVAEVGIEMAVLRARQVGQVRELLTPDQVARLDEMKERREEFREERRERFERRREQRSTP